jgi:ABC-type sugar transport system ATPase subunit
VTVPRLELRDVRKSFDGAPAVRGSTLRLEAGEFLSLLGPSGCGKSTTLAMIAGFLPPDSGDILVDGRRINGLAPQHRGIGLVFQDYAVFTRLTVEANLAFGLEARGVPRRERRARIDEMAETLQLGALMKRRGGSLAMSEMQRVALARVLVTRPSLLLLDEPMSNLDAALRASLRSELKQIQRELGQTVLYVTHDQVEAMSMSDRIAVMSDGRLLQVGTPDEIYHHPATRFVAEFIGDPPINMLPCEVAATDRGPRLRTALHDLAASGTAAGAGRHLLAIRPHDVLAFREPGRDTAPATVVLVENLGAEHVVHVGYGDGLLSVVTPPGFAAIGDTVHLRLDLAHAHVVDATSGAILARGLEARAA